MIQRTERNINPADLNLDQRIGIKLPLNNDHGGVFQSTFTTTEQAITNLKLLIMTRRGERYMHPSYGTDVYSLLFEQNTEDLPDRLSTSLKEDIGFWLPMINIKNIEIVNKLEWEATSPGHGIQIRIDFSVGTFEFGQSLTFVVGSNGGIILA